MDTDAKVSARVRVVDPRIVDGVLAALLTIGALADAASQPHPELGALAVVALVVFTTTASWRRRDPVLATLVAITGLIAFHLASGYNGDGSVEVAVIALNFYTLGRRAQGRQSMFAFSLVFAYWLVGDVVIAYTQAGGSVGEVLGTGILFGGLPFAVGRTLTTRSTLTVELPRELEVFRLLATGMTNGEIAAQLIVGETTVKTHVTRVLMKLGVRDRVQAVVLAYEAGIVNPGPRPQR